MNRALIASVSIGLASLILVIAVMSIAFDSTLLAIGPAIAVSVGVGMAAFFATRPTSHEQQRR